MILKDIIEKEVVFVTKEQKVEEVIKILLDNNISGVPVVDEAKKVIGIVTEADLLFKDIEPRFPSYIELLGGIIYIEGLKTYEKELKKITALTVDQLMTKKVITVSLEDSIQKVATLMIENKINRIPVVDKDKTLIGMISRTDLIKILI